MKKLLALLGAASAVAAPATAVISCVQPQTDNNTNNGGDTDTDGNNNGGGDENTEEVIPTTLEELEKNPFDLKKLESQDNISIESKTEIKVAEDSIVAKINELVNILEFKIELNDLEFSFKRNYSDKVKPEESAGLNAIDETNEKTALITYDIINIKVKSDSDKAKYVKDNSASLEVSKFNLKASSYAPSGDNSVKSFISGIDDSYKKIFGITPNFYDHVDLSFYNDETEQTTIIHDENEASQCFFENGNKLVAKAKDDSSLFTGEQTYQV